MKLITTQVFISLASIDTDVLTKFYIELFSIEPTLIIPQKYSEFQLNSLRLAIFTPKPDHQHEFMHPHQSPLSLCVTVANLDHAIAHLHKIEYPHSTEINTASHGREIYIYDPDGNRIILYQPFAVVSP